jgi:hypothetical protein
MLVQHVLKIAGTAAMALLVWACATPPTAIVEPVAREPASTAQHADAPPRTSPAICPNYASKLGNLAYPREAMGMSGGTARIEFTVRGKEIVDVHAVSASDPVFAAAGADIVRSFHCDSGAREAITFQVPITWKRL